MGDIIEMNAPGRLGEIDRRQGKSTHDLEDQLRKIEEQRQEERTAAALAIGDRLKSDKLGLEDAAILARNLSRIFDDAKARGVMKHEICGEVGMGAEGSSKRLETYILPDRLQGERREKRIDRLTRKSRRYLKLAQACAKLGRMDERDTILSLVDGSSYDDLEEASLSLHVPSEYWSLARTLEAGCKSIARRYALDQIWTLAERHHVTDCVGHWKKDAEWHYYNGFEAPSIRLGYIAGHLTGKNLVHGVLPLRCKILESNDYCKISRVMIAASVHLCLAKWASATAVSPFLGFAPALLQMPDGELPVGTALSQLQRADLVTQITVDERGNLLGLIESLAGNLNVEVAARDLAHPGIHEEVELLVGWHAGLNAVPWVWLPSVIALRARTLQKTLGSLDPIFVDGEWLAPGDHPTLCVEPAAAALERAIVAPETIQGHQVAKGEVKAVSPLGGWPPGIGHLGPIEELLLRTETWRDSLNAFVNELTDAATRALEEARMRYEADD